MSEETRPWVLAAARVFAAIMVVVLVLWPMAASASAATVVPVGRAVGIKLFSDGVVVVGTSEIVTADGKSNPARECGLRAGDIITHINSTEVDTIEEVSALLQELEGEETRHLPDGTLPKAGQLSRIRANTVLGQGDDHRQLQQLYPAEWRKSSDRHLP